MTRIRTSTSTRRRAAAGVALATMVGLVGWGLAPGADAASHHRESMSAARATNLLEARLSGKNEVPGPGDPNGTGHVDIRLRPSVHKVCADVHWAKIGTPLAAHIHRGRAGVSGPVVVDLSGAVTGGPHCTGGVSGKLLKAIKAHPRRYYFNIHTQRYQAGAIRGQLHPQR